MTQDAATSSSDVVRLGDRVIESPSRDSQEIDPALAQQGAHLSQDIDLRLDFSTPTYSREGHEGAGRSSLANESMPALPSTLSDSAHNQARTVADAARPLAHPLRPALDAFRALLSWSWGPETAYPGTVSDSHPIDGDPSGQCGVSSVWLAEVLDRKYSIYSTFCLGSVIFDEHEAKDLDDHCWLEIDGKPGEKLILDLTCDQAGLDKKIVFDSKADLAKKHIRYISRERVNISELPPDNPVWSRYQKLLFNMVMAMLAAFAAKSVVTASGEAAISSQASVEGLS
jgi:hypothetical protein